MNELDLLNKAEQQSVKIYRVNVEPVIRKMLSVIHDVGDFFVKPDEPVINVSELARRLTVAMFASELQYRAEPRARLMSGAVPVEIEKAIALQMNPESTTAMLMKHFQGYIGYKSQEHPDKTPFEELVDCVVKQVMDATYYELDLAVITFLGAFEDEQWRVFSVSAADINRDIIIVKDYGDFRIIEWELMQEKAAEVTDS